MVDAMPSELRALDDIVARIRANVAPVFADDEVAAYNAGVQLEFAAQARLLGSALSDDARHELTWRVQQTLR